MHAPHHPDFHLSSADVQPPLSVERSITHEGKESEIHRESRRPLRVHPYALPSP
ncbi:hypothetical protein BU24DRAFT_419616 [Aaosphaeria arxii CBS 175.79]|uniref:Uncharacterized protein n=1 Tax=Aaosphaeria arxii CBS 175.79 TaxID=1450172 RepID=A0A6A5Y3A9_9PLEO|nr:uncharacterized protein BU24DRAFT_419616 [Aaosphaeria arxii CBS 175.79]KAF2020022.1 hypothetical protein BU24DRAFT_419616 [Aaosphaeria arxii CBS 175.79]